MTTVVLAEKPSVARDIAAVLGASKRRKGYLEGGGYRVTWAVGHLVGLAEPRGIDPGWGRWSLGGLPMLPTHWPLVAREGADEQLAVVRKLLTARATKEVVCATDAGREGELIFRYVYEHVGCKRPVRRLWISSLTAGAIRRGFERLQPLASYDGLAAAARARSRADWLVGMNLSRAYSLRFDDNLSVGRVQTPTLALVVERDLAIQRFVPEPYREVRARFAIDLGDSKDEVSEYLGIYLRPQSPGKPQSQENPQSRENPQSQIKPQSGGREKGLRKSVSAGEDKRRRSWLPADGVEAEWIARRAMIGQARILKVSRKQQRTPPPLLFDLTELQRTANRVYGLSAKRTLQLAQELYEKHKLLSYPRSDSRHLSRDIATTLPQVVAAIADGYGDAVPPKALAGAPLSARFVDDARVTDHHAIIPTAKPSRLPPGSDAFKIYDLVCRRLLQAWCDDYVEAVTRVDTQVVGGDAGERFDDRYRSRGTSVEQPGWKALEPPTKRSSRKRGPKDKRRQPDVPAGLKARMPVTVRDAEVIERSTKPPVPLTDASLLTAMERAGRSLDDKALSDAMRNCGLGTPATRAATIEALLGRGYLVRGERKALRATSKGIDLIERVHEHVRSPAMTGSWEARLQSIERGNGSFDAFMRDIEAYVAEVVGTVKAAAPINATSIVAKPANGASTIAGAANAASTVARSANGASTIAVSTNGASTIARSANTTATLAGPAHTASGYTLRREPVPPDGLAALLKQHFGFERFRAHQFEICAAVAKGRDALVVMPTGAGKSLCYQLPGLARAGTTLVISPLVALIEDQVQKLQQLGLRAECIHAGRGRAASREVCRAYLNGSLDYFFIAPERLGVRGFPQMLAKRPPTLIAIDEAHCISNWGHDFRPDYRMLQQRLAPLRSTQPRPPIVALTATATPAVQRDISEQLGLGRQLGLGKQLGDGGQLGLDGQPGVGAHEFIFGFRRHNIAVEVAEVAVAERANSARTLLLGEGRLPAIVYAPTRKASEQQARVLGQPLQGQPRQEKRLRAAAYHAGMPAAERDKVQRAFSSGALDVVVATVAFGMGIDKADVRTVIHTALPGSIEAYYQEIGRAGRDGKPSRAILMHGFADMRTLEFFLDRDYPPAAKLARVYKALSAEPVARETLASKVTGKAQDVACWIDKLWVAGGAVIDDDGGLRRGRSGWRKDYERQRVHKQAQLDAVRGFARSSGCRMGTLVKHFGDQADDGAPCGLCDVCAPGEALLLRQHIPSLEEVAMMARIVVELRRWNGQASGRLYREIGEASMQRAAFERLLAGLARAGIVQMREDSFDKGKEHIVFQRVDLLDTTVTDAALAARVVFVAAAASEPNTARAGKTRRRSKGSPRRRPRTYTKRTVRPRKSRRRARSSKRSS